MRRRLQCQQPTLQALLAIPRQHTDRLHGHLSGFGT
ncbi:hypothetical protein ACLK19_14215 [Escherichia coli]